MKSLMRKRKKATSEWGKYDEKLLKAVDSSDLAKLRSALKKGGIPSKSNANGRTAIHAASFIGRSDLLEELLKADSEAVNATDEQGRQCLHWTIKAGLLDPTEICLKYNADILAPDSAQLTPLHYAADGGHLEITQLLLEHGAAVAVRDRDGYSPLLLAARRCHPDVCKALIECGSSVNEVDSKGKSVLMYACEEGSRECVELLLKKGVKKDAKDSEGLSAKDYANRNGHNALSKLLQEAPAVASWEITESSHVDDKNEVLIEDVVSKFDSSQVQDDISPTLSKKKNSFEKRRDFDNASERISADQLKELEEENDSLNQELTRLRKDYGYLMEKVQLFEEQALAVSPRRSKSPGEVSKSDQDSQREINLLKQQLENADKDKRALEEQIATLKVQVETFMPAGSDDGLDTDEEMNFEEGEFTLPGMDGPPNKSPLPPSLPVQAQSQGIIEQQLRGQIATLRLENEKLREGSLKVGSKEEDLERLQIENEDLRDQIQELGGGVPTVPMDVYNQLKEAQEEEIASLKRSLVELQSEREQQRAMEFEFAHTSKIRELEEKVEQLAFQLQTEQEKHLKTVSSYRNHLLAAAQGRMAIEVQQALFQIINMRSGGGLNDVLSGDVV